MLSSPTLVFLCQHRQAWQQQGSFKQLERCKIAHRTAESERSPMATIITCVLQPHFTPSTLSPSVHTPTHTCTHTPHLQGRVPAVTLLWHLRLSHPSVPLPSPWYIPDCPIQGQPPVFQCFLSKGRRAIPLLPSSTHIL